MGNLGEIINEALPWILLIICAFFTLVNVSYFYGVFKAKKTDPTIKLSLNGLGKVVLGGLLLIYIIAFIVTITLEIKNFGNADLEKADKIQKALNIPNFLTIITFLWSCELQDVYFIGKKNILIGNRMFDCRRMRKVIYPKRNKIAFVYGQKEYDYSTTFVDMALLKSKITK